MLIKKGQGVGVDVATAEIQTGAVTAAKLATDAVETAKIKDANVTLVKLPQTNRAAEKFLKINSGNTALEWASPSITKDTTIVFAVQTLTLEQLFGAGI